MKEKEPIELTEKDLIDRPAVTGPETAGLGPDKGANPLQFMGQIQDALKQVKAIMDTARSLGLNVNIPGLGGLNKQKGENEPGVGVSTAPPGPQAQFDMFLQLLVMKYGDITVDELVEKLKAEFGARKISKLRGKM
jgi:hypothetical protein